jgi:ribosomal protein L37AE/L43A
MISTEFSYHGFAAHVSHNSDWSGEATIWIPDSPPIALPGEVLKGIREQALEAGRKSARQPEATRELAAPACPFCGTLTIVIQPESGLWVALCTSCNARGPHGLSRANALRQWSVRREPFALFQTDHDLEAFIDAPGEP